MKIQIQVLDCDYKMLRGKPLIRIYGKTEDGEPVCVFYDKFLPYFYTQVPDEKKDDFVRELKAKFNATLEDVERYLPIGYGPKVKLLKITGKDPSVVPEMKELAYRYGTPYEADILFRYRFMTDFGIKGMCWIEADGELERTGTVGSKCVLADSVRPIESPKNMPLKKMALDIETISESGGVHEPGKDPIVMISMAFKPAWHGREKAVVLAKPHKSEDKDVMGAQNEMEMLKKFADIVSDYDPDIITGYNINSFDMPFIAERMRVYGLLPQLGRCEKPVLIKKLQNATMVGITGRAVADTYEIIKRDPWMKFKRYDLRTVARELLKSEKLEIGGPAEIKAHWEGGPEKLNKLIEYCIRDSELALRLVTEKGLLDKFYELAKVSGLLLQDAFGGQAQRHECKLLYAFKQRDIVMPCKPEGDEMRRRRIEREKVGLKGAVVLEPSVGLHTGGCVLVLDFASLYPSIIRSFNICPTTYVRSETDVKFHTSPNGARFVDKEVREGVLPAVVKELVETRAAVKDQMKAVTDAEIKRQLNAKQLALKDMANSLYGYTGYIRSRLYVMDVAGAITGYGRENIAKTKELVEKNFDVKVLYGDSVTAERCVTIMDECGSIMIKSVEELFNEFSHASSTVGPKEIAVVEGYRALTINPKTHTATWAPITKVIRHKAGKKIFRVVQKYGETRATEDHSIMTLNNGQLEETKPQDMNGKKMVKVDDIPRERSVESLDLFEALAGYKVRSVYKGREKIAVVHTDGGALQFGWTNRKEPVTLKRTVSVGTPEMEALCRLIGAYVSEGSSSTPETTKSRMGASIASSDIGWLEQLKKDYGLLFSNAEACIIRSTHGIRILKSNGKTLRYVDHTHKLQMMNGLAAVFFKMLCGQKSDGKHLPNFVFNLPSRYQFIVLENMIRGDGSRKFMNKRLPYSEHYKKNNFSYTTKSLRLASGFTLLLTLFGKKHTLKYRPSKKAYTITTTTNYNSKSPVKVIEEPYDGYVYDLEVEGSHMFADSCGQILLHNTDSIFMKTDIADLDRAQQKGEEIAAYVTERLPGLKFAFEKIFKTFLILSKKRYAGWKFEKTAEGWKDKIEMKGIETVRRDWCELTTESMSEVLRIILKEQDAKKAIIYTRGVVKSLSERKVPLEKLAVVKGVTKSISAYDGIQPHVELAKKIMARDPSKGSMVGERLSYVIVKGNALLSMRAEDPAYAKEKGLEIDSQYYVENQLLPPLERIFDALGVSRIEVLEGVRQKNLAEMFGGAQKSVAPEQTILDSWEKIACVKCGWASNTPSLSGVCPKCGDQIFFSKGGELGKFVKG